MENLFLLTISIFILGSICSLITKNGKLANAISSSFAVAGSISGIILGVVLLLTQTTLSIKIPTTLPLLNLSITIDPLSALFVLIVSTISLASSIYGYGYMQKYVKEYSLGAFGFFYNLFIASLLLVVTASNGLYFLFVWELMSLTSYFLVIFENKKRENIEAGLLYLVMTHFGTAFISLAFLLLYMATGSFDFDVIRMQSANIPLATKNLIFVLGLIGFGTKAGIIPLHIWLPRAHPAAPSQVSALMSGVMIKTAILLLIRLFLDLIPSGAIWWGPVVLVLGAVSSLLGVLYALSEHDIKKLLAYHSVENIGIILMGLGAAMTFYSLGVMPLAILGAIATLYHTINHAVFKSLLFFGAGSVAYQTHTYNMEEYGGLIKKMPFTAFFFLIGAIAISAMPPFNGFASEWLTYQALFTGVLVQSTTIKAIFILAIASLAFTGGLAAACFVKAFAVTFLAKPRSHESQNAKESPLSMNIAMSFLSIACLLLGVLAGFIVPQLNGISLSLAALNTSTVSSVITSTPMQVAVGQGFAYLNLPMVLASLLAVFILVFSLVYLKTRSQKIEIVDTWDCGAPPLTTRAEITSISFARSLITMFSGILKHTKQNTIEYSDANTRYFTSSQLITLNVPNLYEEKLYRPLHKILGFVASKISVIQSGNVNQYLLYIFITLIGLIIWSRF